MPTEMSVIKKLKNLRHRIFDFYNFLKRFRVKRRSLNHIETEIQPVLTYVL